MYSERLYSIFKKVGVAEGDTVRITKGTGQKGDGEAQEGILMPQPQGDPNCMVLKLKSGYNIGIAHTAETKIELLKKGAKSEKPSEGHAKHEKGALSMLSCGGTIASKVEQLTGAVYGTMNANEILSVVPELKELGPLNMRSLFTILSEDISPDHWKVMAREIEKEIKAGATGVVLPHGTDTMSYSAAALSFMVRPPVPVVLVGTQRSSDRGSSDNVVNLICAATAAKSDIAEVGVCMHASASDDICHFHRGARVRKMHTSRRDAFRSIDAKPLASITYKTRKVQPLDSNYTKRGSRPLVVDDKINPNVALIYAHPGIKPSLIAKLSDYDGVVFAGTGLGQVPTNVMNNKLVLSILPEVKALMASGIPVVMSPQTIYGRLNMHVYSGGRLLKEAGVIGDGCDWLPEVALVKLMWVLGHTKKMEEVKRMMLENLVGELTERSPLEMDYFE
ncbi:MAG: Glu-tRNA(Gln) amidotransferase subunit GatD [Candidatus Burarchaeum sp.]|nr:Glu-tRNA(Gln) amidotransferase subunit GatD [Candidatus Burarchaeum sp.]MDO8339700.1 Glu-tRNA(Gln) amidotransferase subunit GatD [Candidatus Burarchaeum sp.]